MSTFAVFGMTRDVAQAEAKKRTKGTRKNVKAPGGVEPVPLAEWLELVEKKTEQIMGGGIRFASSLRCSMPRSTPSNSLSWPRGSASAGRSASERSAPLPTLKAIQSSIRRQRRQRLAGWITYLK